MTHFNTTWLQHTKYTSHLTHLPLMTHNICWNGEALLFAS